MLNKIVIFIIVLLFASFLRLYGVNWDAGQHLHPDERFLTMVTTDISWPRNIFEYLNTDLSPLNPHNRGYGFFVYGLFPLTFTKWIADMVKMNDYGNLIYVGRRLSAFADIAASLLVYLIAKKMISLKSLTDKRFFIPILAMFLYSTMVLPIQLSHFYAVDTYLTLFLLLSFYFLILLLQKNKFYYSLLAGTAYGLSLASKISALLFLPIVALLLFFRLLKIKNKISTLVLSLVFILTVYVSFRVGNPYVFAKVDFLNLTLNPKILANWHELKSFSSSTDIGYPPGIQWIRTKPYLFPIKNILLWGLGLPHGIIVLSSLIFFSIWIVKSSLSNNFKKYPTDSFLIILSFLWIVGLFIYQGGQLIKALRYIYPVYPFMAILSAFFIYHLLTMLREKLNTRLLLLSVICCLLIVIIYPLSFISIYSKPHTRVEASKWIINNLPEGSKLSSEHWDDGLPLSIPQNLPKTFTHVEFPLYYPDSYEKWTMMAEKLAEVDYIVISSNRLYGSIMTVPDKYPTTVKFYQALFSGRLGFTKVAEFTSRPNIPLPFIRLCLTPPFARYGYITLNAKECQTSGVSFVDDYADETFTVYDHPKVLIFKKVKNANYLNILFSD